MDENCQDILQAEKECADDFSNIDSLPEEILMMIFKFLTLDELCRAGRVCNTWYKITRNEDFWRKIRVNIPQFDMAKSEAFMTVLPSSVTSISLNPDATEVWYLNFRKFSKELREKCPFLQTLILHYASIEVEKEDIVQNCIELPENIRVLVLRYSDYFTCSKLSDELKNPISNIEVLDLSYSPNTVFSCYSFKHMPNLKKLHLSNRVVPDEFFMSIGPFINQLHVFNLECTGIGSKTFDILLDYGEHLTELYLCWARLEDRDFFFRKPKNPLPCLKTICLRCCDVTCIGIFYLILSCPSLHKVFVGRDYFIPVTDYSFCNLEIVEVLNDFAYCCHSNKIDYMSE